MCVPLIYIIWNRFICEETASPKSWVFYYLLIFFSWYRTEIKISTPQDTQKYDIQIQRLTYVTQIIMNLIINFRPIQEVGEATEEVTEKPEETEVQKPEMNIEDRLLQVGLQNETSDGEQKKNVLDKITDKGKDFISIIYPPFEEERNEQKFDDSERKKAEKYARSNEEVLLSNVLGISTKDSEHAPLAQVVEGRVITESTQKALEGIEGNSKLWIGKDYVNFIVKDFNSLDLPFVGGCTHVTSIHKL